LFEPPRGSSIPLGIRPSITPRPVLGSVLSPIRSPRPAGLRQFLAGRLPILGLALLGAGCASYSSRTEGALNDFQGGHLERSMEAYGDRKGVGSDFLSGAEAGTVALTAGWWEEARRHFHRAAREAEEIEGRALAGVEGFAEMVGSWAINDTLKDYPGEGFERVYVHCGLALTYLAEGLLDDVFVEARLANQLLEAEEKLYERSYRAGGLGHFLSAVTYELRGEYDEAYIDYARMEEKGVGCGIAGPALVRLARRLGRPDERARWEEKYGPDIERPPGAASVVVLAGVGLAPFKVEESLGIMTEDGLIVVAVPAYVVREPWVTGVRLVEEGSGVSVRAEVLESVTEVAIENMADRLAWMAAKSVARGLLKRELTKELEEKHGLGGRLLGDFFAAITERADVRCWRTLPDSWQACRMFVPPGVHRFTLEAIGGPASFLGSFELEEGETMVVLARTVGGNLYAHAIGGRLLEMPPPVALGEGAVVE
jgi:uncharacterized protein